MKNAPPREVVECRAPDCETCWTRPCVCEETYPLDGEDLERRWMRPEMAIPPHPTVPGAPQAETWWVEEVLPRQQIVAVFGAPGAAKTRSATSMVCAALAGVKALDRFPTRKAQRVLWINADMPSEPARDMGRNTIAVLGLPPQTFQLVDEGSSPLAEGPALLYMDGGGIHLDRKGGSWTLSKLVSEHKPDILLLDSMSELMSGDPAKLADAKTFWRSLKDAQALHPFTAVTLAHTNKQGKAYGSIHNTAAVDVTWLVERTVATTADGYDTFHYRCMKTRLTPVIRGFDFRIKVIDPVKDRSRLVWLRDVTDNLSAEEREDVLNALAFAVEIEDLNRMRQERYDSGSFEEGREPIMCPVTARDFVRKHKDELSDKRARDAFRVAVDAGWLRRLRRRGRGGLQVFEVTKAGREWAERNQSDVPDEKRAEEAKA